MKLWKKLNFVNLLMLKSGIAFYFRILYWEYLCKTIIYVKTCILFYLFFQSQFLNERIEESIDSFFKIEVEKVISK